MRITFFIPNEPPPELTQAIRRQGVLDPDKLKQILFDYFVSEDRPQTYVLPRSILREKIEGCIGHMLDVAKEFPTFELETDASKFITCCYESIWRALLLEWKARMIMACGRKPADTELPRGFDPWIDLPSDT
jgi:hypothetical protein